MDARHAAGESRLRLVAKDPYWLFAHWELDARALGALRAELGERAAAVSALTLRVADPRTGDAAVLFLPRHSRSQYLATDSVRRPYRAEVGLTLPSGRFRKLAESETVLPPPLGQAAEPARERASYHDALRLAGSESVSRRALAELPSLAAGEAPLAAARLLRGGASDLLPYGAGRSARAGASELALRLRPRRRA